MHRRERADPSWPYEEVEAQERIASDPSWACVTGFCACHAEAEQGSPGERFSILLCDEQARRMRGARCRVIASGLLLNEDRPHADGDAWITVQSRQLPEQVLVEWAPPDTPLAPHLPFRRLYYVTLDDADREEAARRRLFNLGFSEGLDLEDLVRQFQRSYRRIETGLLADVEADLQRFHDQGIAPAMGQSGASPGPGAFLLVADTAPGAEQQQAGGPPTSKAGSTHGPKEKKLPVLAQGLTLVEAVARFRLLVADDNAVDSGQFAWLVTLAEALDRHCAGLIRGADPNLRGLLEEELGKPLGGSLGNGALKELLLAAAKAKVPAFEDALADVKQRLEKYGEQEPVTTLRKTFTGSSVEAARTFCSAMNAPYGKGDDRRVYEKIASSRHNLKFQLLFHMTQASRDRCHAFVGATAMRLQNREAGGKRGLNGDKALGEKPVNTKIYQGDKRGQGTFLMPGTDPKSQAASFGELVIYRPDLPELIHHMKHGFNPGRGWVIRAGVQSGLLAEKGVHEPDHWMLLIAAEGNDFAYWDPDSAETLTDLGQAFGRMIFALGDGSVKDEKDFPAAQYVSSGRLTTARTDNELRCVDGIGGHYTLKGADKRYQVTHVDGLGKK